MITILTYSRIPYIFEDKLYMQYYIKQNKKLKIYRIRILIGSGLLRLEPGLIMKWVQLKLESVDPNSIWLNPNRIFWRVE